MSDIFREVEEDVRRDRLTHLWQRFGKQAIGVIVAVLAVAAAWIFWQDMKVQERRDEAARFLEATRAEDPVQALGQVAGDLTPGYGALARMRTAAAQVDDDPAAAAAAFDAIAADAAVPQDLRDLARIRALLARADTLAPSELQEQAAALASGSFPYRYTALELQAVAEMVQGQGENAARTLQTILDDQKAPPAVRERAGVLLDALKARGVSS